MTIHKDRHTPAGHTVYVLTSSGQDIYADMTLISLYSLRQSNPSFKVTLLCDVETVEALELANHKLIQGR